MSVINKVLIITSSLLSFGCASIQKEKILQNMAIAGVVGYLIGQQKEESKGSYSAMYAGLGASAAAVATIYFNSNEDEKIKQENEVLKLKLDQFQKRLEPQLVQKGNSLFSGPLPKEVAGLVEPGEWRRYKMDQWVQDPNQSNTWYRQIEMFEIIPPTTK